MYDIHDRDDDVITQEILRFLCDSAQKGIEEVYIGATGIRT